MYHYQSAQQIPQNFCRALHEHMVKVKIQHAVTNCFKKYTVFSSASSSCWCEFSGGHHPRSNGRCVIQEAASMYNGDKYEKLLVWQAPLVIDESPGQHWCPWMENLCLFPSDPVTRQTLCQPTDHTNMCKRWCWWGLKPEAMNPKSIGDLMNNRRSKMHVQSHCIIRKISQIRVHVLLQYKARWVTSLRSMNFLIWSIWCNGKLWATDLKFSNMMI
jgi:hypothetical protein